MGGPVIDDRGADRQHAIDRRSGRRGDACFLEIRYDIGIQSVQIAVRGDVAEADDVQRDGRQTCSAGSRSTRLTRVAARSQVCWAMAPIRSAQ